MLALSIALVFPLLLLVVLVEDRTTRLLLACFAWGSVAGFLAYTINTALIESVGISLESLQIQFAPVTEEFVKAAPLFALYALSPARLRSRTVVLAAVFVGIGFSVVENYWYLVERGDMGTLELAVFVGTRSLSTTIMHGLATGIVGFSLHAVAVGTFDRVGFRPVFVLVGCVLAIMVHGYFNLYVQFGVLGETIAVGGALTLYLLSWLLLRRFSSRTTGRRPTERGRDGHGDR